MENLAYDKKGRLDNEYYTYTSQMITLRDNHEFILTIHLAIIMSCSQMISQKVLFWENHQRPLRKVLLGSNTARGRSPVAKRKQLPNKRNISRYHRGVKKAA